MLLISKTSYYQWDIGRFGDWRLIFLTQLGKNVFYSDLNQGRFREFVFQQTLQKRLFKKFDNSGSVYTLVILSNFLHPSKFNIEH